MNLDEYQTWTRTTAAYPAATVLPIPVIYCSLKLAGEAGEVADKIGKVIRDQGGVFTGDSKLAVVLELGDVLWYVARLADELGFTMSQIAGMNQTKLEDRKIRGKIKGSGDSR